jgi:cytochrome c553
MKLLMHSLSLSLVVGCLLATSATAGDAKVGEQKSESCLGCHGQNGNSNSVQWPKLAGQQATYLEGQMKAFKSGQRSNTMMQAIAASLSDEDISNLAAYFSSQKLSSAGADAALAKNGQPKASMCLGCHGIQGEGKGQFPRLAGQHPAYLAAQLSSFKNGSRKSGPMQAVAAGLSEEDFKELAAYFGSL